MIVTETIVRATGSPEYQAIREHYADQDAARSGVPLMHCIEECLVVLSELGASEDAMRAFCLHPLFLADEDLVRYGQGFLDRVDADPFVILLVMEFRNQANAFPAGAVDASEGVVRSTGRLPSAGPLEAVRHMLIAHTVQARKEFIRHHKGRAMNSQVLEAHFDQWLKALDVDRSDYEELCAAIDFAIPRR